MRHDMGRSLMIAPSVNRIASIASHRIALPRRLAIVSRGIPSAQLEYAFAYTRDALTHSKSPQPPARIRPAGKTVCEVRTVGEKDGDLDWFGVSEVDSYSF